MSWADARSAVGGSADRGLVAAASILLRAAEAVTPVDTAQTKESGDSGLIGPGEAAVVFVGPKAIALHENLHDRHRAGKQAKYLEQPLHQQAAAMQAAIAEGVRDGFH